jgi:hypothetical protein
MVGICTAPVFGVKLTLSTVTGRLGSTVGNACEKNVRVVLGSLLSTKGCMRSLKDIAGACAHLVKVNRTVCLVVIWSSRVSSGRVPIRPVVRHCRLDAWGFCSMMFILCLRVHVVNCEMCNRR